MTIVCTDADTGAVEWSAPFDEVITGWRISAAEGDLDDAEAEDHIDAALSLRPGESFTRNYGAGGCSRYTLEEE